MLVDPATDEGIVIDALGALPPMDECLDLQPPHRATLGLSRARVLTRAARYEEAFAVTQEVARRAEDSDRVWVDAAVAAAQAEIDIAGGRFSHASRRLESALQAARSIGSDILRASIATSLARVYLEQQRIDARVVALIDEATVAAARLGRPPQVTAGILSTRGKLAYARGEFAEAADWFTEAEAVLLAATGPRFRSDRMEIQEDLGRAAFMLSDNETALEAFTELTDARIEQFGPEHPSVARSVQQSAAALSSLGWTRRAESLYRRALAIANRTAPMTPLVDTIELGLGKTLLDADPEAAAEILARLVARCRGRADRTAAIASLQLAHAYEALLRPRDAITAYRENLAYWDAHRPAHPNAVLARAGLAMTLVELGDVDAGVELLTEAERILAARPVGPGPRGEIQLLLARLLWSREDQLPRARRLATKAIADLRGGEGPPFASLLDEATRLRDAIDHVTISEVGT